jgi:hypothetical protein
MVRVTCLLLLHRLLIIGTIILGGASAARCLASLLATLALQCSAVCKMSIIESMKDRPVSQTASYQRMLAV